ncbi:unnamed protein product, partial [Mesorhabditis belari]|uniref:Serrate RNA effector molecule homolog n=1 Tax=Mesorhabditis belari TaxID=2138241 RepID=A0AAF3FR17_9BILA
MAMYDSDEEDRRRDGAGGRFPRERGGGDRSFTSSYDRNGGGGTHPPPDPSDRRPPFKRSYGASFRKDDDPAPKRTRNETQPDLGPKFVKNETGKRPDGMEPMLSLQKYALENGLTDDAPELHDKYEQYKDEYHKRQYKMFFEAHKNEEWFKQKYHPTELKTKFTHQKEEIKRRLAVYNRLKNEGHLNEFSLEPENARNIVRLMNAVIVLLGGADDEMLSKVLSAKVSESTVTDVKLEGIELPDEEGKNDESQLIERYASIIIRCIPSTMTAIELKEVCERCPGFIRLHLNPAQSETNWTRKAIAAFKQNVDLKDVCLGINNIKVKGGELVAYANSESGERVRVSHPFINHKETALRFLHYALKILAVFDKKFGFFSTEDENVDFDSQLNELRKDLALGTDFVGKSTNPLIEKLRVRIPGRIKDETMHDIVDKMPSSSEIVFERDDNLLSSLDEIVFYLRVVYSFDLFDRIYYDDEDSLPNNMELFHIRNRDPPNNEGEMKTMKRGARKIFEQEAQKHLEAFFTARCISETRLIAYGLLDPEVAVEEMIVANTVKLSDEKWLCPLSGKKFKGPEFIKKHIQSKHAEAIDEARADSLYYNNYLCDYEKPTDQITDQNDHKNNDPRERRRMAPPRREERSPRKEAFRENNASFRRNFVGYKDLDAVVDTEVANVF